MKVPVGACSRRTCDERVVICVHRPELTHHHAVVSQVVLLVVILGGPEALQGLDAGRGFAAVQALVALSALESRRKLLLASREDERRVLDLEGGTGGVVTLPEQLQQILVGDYRRVEVDLEALGLVAERAVGGVWMVAARVADTRAPDPVDEPEPGVRSPESTNRERRGLQLIGDLQIDRWQGDRERDRGRLGGLVKWEVHRGHLLASRYPRECNTRAATAPAP